MNSHRDRDEWRQRRAWPATMRFIDATTERIIEQHLPPRPDRVEGSSVGCATSECAAARFAEDDEPSLSRELNR